MTWVLASFFAYMLFILVVGVLAGRKTRGDMQSYYLADRKVGAWVTAISASASSESGWLVLGCVAMGYIYGLSAYWITLGCLLGFLFNWLFFAERIRKQSAANGAITVPEFLERVTGDQTKLIRLIGVVIIFVLMFTYVAAQLNAAGLVLQIMFSWPYTVGVLIGAAVTVFYTTVGGFRAVCWTDLWQGLLMAAALIVLPVLAFVSIGGFGKVSEKVREQPAQRIYVYHGYVGDEYRTVRVEKGRDAWFEGQGRARLYVAETTDEESGEVAGEPCLALPGEIYVLQTGEDPTVVDLSMIGVEGSLQLARKHDLIGGDAFFSLFGGMATLVLLGWIVEMLGIGLGYPGSPHVVARFMAARSATEIRRGRAIALTWALVAEGGAITMGILARALLPDLADPQGGLLATAEMFLPGIVVGLILAAVFAALRSTADSQLLVASSAVVRDFFQHVLGMKMDDRKALSVSRVVVLVLGILAVALALTENRFIFWFVLFSWAGLGASFGPSLVLAVFWRKLSSAGVIASMLAGFATTILWKLVIRGAIKEAHGVDVYELVPAFLVSFVVAVVVSLLAPRKRGSEQE